MACAKRFVWVLVLLLASCGASQETPLWPFQPFDLDLWKAADPASPDGEVLAGEPRWKMRHGVPEHVKLGMSMQEVEAVLGPRSGEHEYEDVPGIRDFLRWEYWLRKRRGGYPAPYLAVWFDSKDRVQGITIEDVKRGLLGFRGSIRLSGDSGDSGGWDLGINMGPPIIQRPFDADEWDHGDTFRVRMFGEILDGKVVKTGMTKEEVHALLGTAPEGTPDEWIWEEEFNGIDCSGSLVLHIAFEDGRVTRLWIEDKLRYE